jgi:ABC-type spermidine/putrescine transport system permease subunit I
MLLQSFTNDNSLQLPLLDLRHLRGLTYTWGQYTTFFSSHYYQNMLFQTIYIALLAVIGSVVVGTPVSYLIAQRRFRYRSLVRWVTSLPIFLPNVVAAYALLIFFGPFGTFSTVVHAVFHVQLQLGFSVPSVIAATFYVIVPTYVMTAASAFESIPPELAEASQSLGARQFHTFRHILIPLAMPGILAGIILSFTLAIGLIVIALVVGGGSLNVHYLPVEIMQQSTTYNYNIPFAAALAAVLLVLSLIGQFLVTALLAGRRR